MLAEFDMSESSYLLYKNIKVRSYMKSSQEGLWSQSKYVGIIMTWWPLIGFQKSEMTCKLPKKWPAAKMDADLRLFFSACVHVILNEFLYGSCWKFHKLVRYLEWLTSLSNCVSKMTFWNIQEMNGVILAVHIEFF